MGVGHDRKSDETAVSDERVSNAIFFDAQVFLKMGPGAVTESSLNYVQVDIAAFNGSAQLLIRCFLVTDLSATTVALVS